MLVRNYSYLLLLGFSITVSFFVSKEDSKNLFLVGVMALSPFFLLIEKKRYDSVDRLMFLFLFLALVVCLMHLGSFRPASYIYTFCFVTSFVFLKSIIQRKGFTLEFLTKFLRKLIYLYGVILLIQQFCVLLGIHPILANAFDAENPWKLPSLTPEPSHLARFVFFIMYAYVVLREISLKRKYVLKDAKKEIMVWLLYFWLMMTCGSTTALLFVFLIFLRYIKLKNVMVSGMFFGFLFVLMQGTFGDNEAFNRILNLGPALKTISPEEINAADHSAAHRILPIFVFFQWLNPSTVGFWLGNGMDYGLNWCREYMYMISGDSNYAGQNVNLGGVTIMFVDYGIIVMGVFISSLIRFFRNVPDKFLVICWIPNK